MIIDELIIEDFGVYGGRQSIDLSPPSSKQPVVLIGGLNGGGKTTLLDAIQLCLYGKFAVCSNRGSLAYSEFLRRCIHQRQDNQSSSLELLFRHTVDGVEEQYHVSRSWHVQGESTNERFHVVRNGEPDAFLSDHWVESVERILPRRIANLFLFDGEKIESYASPEAAADLIKTATHSLLGMDIVDQLERDLDTLTQRTGATTRDSKLRHDVDEVRQEFERIASERRTSHRELAQLRSHLLDPAKKKIEVLDLEFQQKGGDLFDRQLELEQQLAETNKEISNLNGELQEIAAGSLPLMLIQPLVVPLVKQAMEEIKSRHNEEFVSEVDERDAVVLRMLEQHDVSTGTVGELKSYFDKDREGRLSEIVSQPYLGLSGQEISQIEHAEDAANQVSDAARCMLAELETLKKKRSEKEAELMSVPAEEVVRDLIIERNDTRDLIEEITAKIANAEDEMLRMNTVYERAKQSLSKVLDRQVRADFDDEDNLRIINHAAKVQKTLSAFRSKAVARHIGRIEQFITDSFNSLVRKDELLSSVKIAPETFELTLEGNDGAVLSAERLSAGERQLLAIAILWGLARASNRQLPMVIDTPLGRLDSEHRGSLVDRYFPKASHQVILLSTDEEIANGYLTRLAGSIGKTYELVFDEKTNTTAIHSGYFESEVVHVH